MDPHLGGDPGLKRVSQEISGTLFPEELQCQDGQYAHIKMFGHTHTHTHVSVRISRIMLET